MQIQLPIKSRSLQGVSDLTLIAPIKRGLIPALDTRSYESRLRMLLKTIGSLRISAREVEPVQLFSDAVERIRSIHSFRLAILDTEPRQLLLAVTFDSAWEPYMRRIWRDLGPLLDVIFCNCEGYVTAHGHSFAEYTRWVRSAQANTEFFYNAAPVTVDDLHYLRQAEKRHIDGPPQAQQPGAAARPAGSKFIDDAMPALSALYRLADMYPPDTDDGGCLLRAAHHLLRELADQPAPQPDRTPQPATDNQESLQENPRFEAQRAWFKREKPSGASRPPAAQTYDAADVQGGIAKSYDGVTHGALLLIGLDGPAAAQSLLQRLRKEVTAEANAKPNDGIFVNFGLTFEGLRIAGLATPRLDELPQEFREGMEARASVLGDYRCNHPKNWSPPERNWPQRATGAAARIELSTVHVIVQLACTCTPAKGDHEIAGNEKHPLHKKANELVQGLAGVRLLSVQAMRRHLDPEIKLPRDHFGFVDGISQPKIDASGGGGQWNDRVAVGDLLLGHENSLGDPPTSNPLWKNGTFLVIRKLRQDVQALDDVLQREATPPTLTADAIKAKMMGRTVDGEALADPGKVLSNNFDYRADSDGARCPLQSHVRRTNPRTAENRDRLPVPRIFRRGMSYGPPHNGDKNADRGLVFMAYNASIAEQFEVIQRWISGADGSGSYSALRDPFLGVPQDDDPRMFAFKHNGVDFRVDLRSDRPFVHLQWGAYVFVPSITAIGELVGIAEDAAKEAQPQDMAQKPARRDPALNWSAAKGAALIARLLAAEQKLGFEAAAEQWKTMLEDISARTAGLSASIWAAVRELHRGVLRTPYGILVCSKDLVMEVFDNHGSRYTATGYAQRMEASFGRIYLGLDDDGPESEYKNQSKAANEAIGAVGYQEAFDLAFKEAKAVLSAFVAEAKQSASGAPWEITIDVKEIVDPVLASVSHHWFGLPDGREVEEGGWDWNWTADQDRPRCPAHFHSPSRYMFQPNPGPEASEYGEKHGKVLRDAVERFVASHRAANPVPSAPLAKSLFAAMPGDNKLLASTLIGVMMGFLPTVDGNLRASLYEWINDRSLWDHQLAYLACLAEDLTASRSERAEKVLLAPLMRTMQLRPVPELVWRIALTKHGLRGVEVMPGDKLVVSIVSATQQDLADGKADVFPIFGGNRGKFPHPTHACPGYKMAMGVLLGVIAALLESATLRPTLAPLSLSLRGE